jgi:uncharacterized membrane protein YczE
MEMTKKELVLRSMRALLGLAICGTGTYLMLHAAIGLTPWETFRLGLSVKGGISYGTATTLVGAVVVIMDLLLGERIGLGTIFDVFFTGRVVDFVAWLDLVPDPVNTAMSVVMLLLGMFILSFGQFFYMKAGLSCGPTDSFAVGVARRFKKLPFGLVNNTIMAIVLLLGALLGAQIGIGTIIGVCSIGVVQQSVFSTLRFDPRSVDQNGIRLQLSPVRGA